MKMTRDIDIKTAELKDLIAWYNENSGSKTKVTKFKDRASAEENCHELYTAINEIASGNSKAKPAKPAKESAASKKAAKPAKAKKEGEEGEDNRGRVSKYAGKKIHRLVKENPRREGSHGHKSFEVIPAKGGISYEDYIAGGGRSNDLAYDIDKEFAEVK